MKRRAATCLIAALTLITGVTANRIFADVGDGEGVGKAAGTLAGKLVVTDGKGGAADFAFEKEPEFYMVYHSASW